MSIETIRMTDKSINVQKFDYCDQNKNQDCNISKQIKF